MGQEEDAVKYYKENCNFTRIKKHAPSYNYSDD